MKAAVQRAINEEYLRDEGAGEEEYGGNLILVRDVVAKYVNSCILPYDASQTGFVMRGWKCRCLSVRIREGNGSIRSFSQESPTGSTCSPTACCAWSITKRANGISGSKISNRCFFGDIRERSAAVLQTLLYSLMLTRSEKCDVQPALYYVRNMQEPDFSPLLLEGNTPVVRFRSTARSSKVCFGAY